MKGCGDGECAGWGGGMKGCGDGEAHLQPTVLLPALTVAAH